MRASRTQRRLPGLHEEVEECRSKRLYVGDVQIGAPSADKERFVFDTEALEKVFSRQFGAQEMSDAVQEAADAFKRSRV